MFLQLACPRFLVIRFKISLSWNRWRALEEFGWDALGALLSLALLKKTGLCCLVLADVSIRHVKH
jgi:hypothetical protein